MTQPHDPSSSPRLLIKKYPNRRYYDATHSRHVTLEEIYRYVREGYEVQATDSKTGQDITAKVLAQIIIELDPPKLGVFPVSLLHRLLRSNEQLVRDVVQKYFNQPLTAMLDSQRNAEHYFRQAMGLPTATPTAADWAKMMWGPFAADLWRGPTKPEMPPDSPAPGAGAQGDPLRPAPPAAAVPPVTQEERGSSELRQLVESLREEVLRLREQHERSAKGRSSKRSPRPRRRPAQP